MGAIAAVGIGAAVGGYFASRKRKGGGSNQLPPVVTAPPAQNAIAPAYQPVNFTQVIDTLAGNRMQIVRGTDQKISVMFDGKRIPVDEAINTGSFNSNLPAIRQVRGRDIELKAGAVMALTSAMSKLSDALEVMENTAPQLIPQNQALLSSFKASRDYALQKNFDLKQSGIEQILAKRGMLNSTTGLGAAIALARQKSEALLQDDLEYNLFAQKLKLDSQEAMYKRGENIANTANIELNRYATETATALEMRDQDMRTDVQLQGLEQERAMNQANLQLSRNDQLINAEVNRRQLALGQQNMDQNRLLNTGLSLFDSGNNYALNARSIDNTAAANFNQANLVRYSMQSNPYKTALNAGIGQFTGSFGAAAGDRLGNYLLPPDPNNKKQQRTGRIVNIYN